MSEKEVKVSQNVKSAEKKDNSINDYDKKIYILNANQEEEEKDGITFGQICGRIWKGKIVWVSVTAGVFLVAFLGLHYGYTKPTRTYKATVNYNVSSFENDTYPDGRAFDYRTLINEESLTSIKESDDSFASIDVDKMINNGGISIAPASVTSYTTSGTEITTDSHTSYTLTVKSSYFSSKTQGKKFVESVFAVPYKTVENYYQNLSDTYLSSFDNVRTFDTQLTMLETQYNKLLSAYSTMISLYGNNYIPDSSTGTTLGETYENIVAYFRSTNSSTLIDLLQYQVESYGYIKDADYSSSVIALEICNLTRQQSINEAKIEALTNKFTELYGNSDTQNSSTAIAEQIQALIDANIDIKYQLEILNTQKTNIDNGTYQAPATFTTYISTYKTQLVTYTSQMISDEKIVYTDAISMSYEVPNTITKIDKLSIGKNFAISVILALFIGLTSGYISGNIAEKKYTK